MAREVERAHRNVHVVLLRGDVLEDAAATVRRRHWCGRALGVEGLAELRAVRVLGGGGSSVRRQALTCTPQQVLDPGVGMFPLAATGWRTLALQAHALVCT